jgi:hypothetical protein
MSALREAVLLQMRLRGFAANTVDAYIHAMEELWKFFKRPLDRLTCEEVQRFLDEIITVRKRAWATVNVYFSAYRFLYLQVLNRPAQEFSIPPRGRSGKRPGVLSRQEVERLIAAPLNLKHRALLAMTYGSGLRVSEVVRVRIADVDRGRMMLFIGDGKGHKDRYTVLSKRALRLTVNWVLQHFAQDPQWRLQGQLGFLAILHTWTQRLKLHFHVHCIVPGGVWRDDSKEWVPRRSRWLFREESLADAFRNRFLRRLSSLRRRGKLVYKGRAALLADEVAWEAWRASLASQSWIVFSQPPPIQHPSPKGCATRPRPGSVWTRQKTAPRDRRDANHRCPRPAKHVLDRFCCLDRFANPCPTHPAA